MRELLISGETEARHRLVAGQGQAEGPFQREMQVLPQTSSLSEQEGLHAALLGP